MHWTVVAIATGGGADGEGASPLPCLCLVSSASRIKFYRLPYACSPLPGARAVLAISSGKPCPGSGADIGFPGRAGRADPGRDLPRISPCTGPWWLSPRGVGLTGRGRAPSPVSASCLQRPDSNSTDCHTPVAPSRGRGQSWRYPVGSRARGAALTSVSREGRGEPTRGGIFLGSPRALDRGGYRHGGWGRER